MDKFWIKSYPAGVPAEIDYTRYRSLVHLMDEAFSKFAQRNAYVCMDRFLTYAELDVMSTKLGAWLQAQGLAPGARVALMMPNVLQYPIAIAAVLRAGYIVVNVNPLYTPRELERMDDGQLEIIAAQQYVALTSQIATSWQTRLKLESFLT